MSVRTAEIIPGVHMFAEGVWQAYLVREADRLTLIDTGAAGNADAFVRAIEGAGGRAAQLRQIIVTHYHDDHRGSLAELAERTGARVLAGAEDAAVVRGEQEQPPPNITEAWERELYERIAKDAVPPAPPSHVDRMLRDGDETDVDGGARVVGVPGHTPGSIAIYVPSRGLLFTGDAVATVDGAPICGVFNIDTQEARASFRNVAELEFDVACVGHGAPVLTEAALALRRAADRLH